MNNWPKFLFACLSMACMTVLMVAEIVSSDVGVPFLTIIAGYMLGNGIAARKNQPQQNLFKETE